MTQYREQMLSTAQKRERSILKNVYLWMTAGLGLTGVVAYAVATNPAVMNILLGSRFGFLLLVIVQLGLVVYLSARIEQMSSTSAIIAFGSYAIVTGITFSTLF